MEITIIYTSVSEPIVHRTGCSDITKDRKHARAYEMTAASREDVAREVYEDEEDPSSLVSALHWKGCTKGL